jgi:hypothetical protein
MIQGAPYWHGFWFMNCDDYRSEIQITIDFLIIGLRHTMSFIDLFSYSSVSGPIMPELPTHDEINNEVDLVDFPHNTNLGNTRKCFEL